VIDTKEESMKTKLLVTLACVVTLLWTAPTPAFAGDSVDTTSVVVDVAVARPFSFVLTVVGTALFVVSLPISATSGSVDKAAHTLVAAPAKDTFTRPLGELENFLEY
jgi:hypothetical protein